MQKLTPKMPPKSAYIQIQHQIYISRLWGIRKDTNTTYLGVIHRPNDTGARCNYQHLGLYLGDKNYSGGLMYMPPLHMGPLTFDDAVRLPRPDTICPGDSVRLNLAPAYAHVTYHWAPPDGLTAPDSAHPIAAPDVTTTYTLTTTAAAESFWGAQQRTDTVRVVVRNPDLWPCNPSSRPPLREDKPYFSVYPNPAGTEVTLDYTLPAGMTGEVEINSITGARVRRQDLTPTKTQTTIPVSQWAPGIYACRFRLSNGTQMVQKLVVIH